MLEATLTAHNGGTLVAIAHSGLPDGERHRHALGWRHYLACLFPSGHERRPGTARDTG